MEQQTKHETKDCKLQVVIFANLPNNVEWHKFDVCIILPIHVASQQTTTQIQYPPIHQTTNQVDMKKNIKPLLPICWIKKPHKTKNQETSKAKLKKKRAKKSKI